jgi:hypothetical protein
MNAVKEIRSLLQKADPLRSEPGLAGVDAERMRRAILGSSRESEPTRAFWSRAVAVAAVLALMVAAGTITGLKLPRDSRVAGGTITRPTDAGERVQVQFATPGGTRIIWTLDPHFKLGEVAP